MALFQPKRFALPMALVLAAVVGLGATFQAWGDDDGDEDDEYQERGNKSGEYHEGKGRNNSLMNVMNATWQTECSACHMAYPPGLLPADSWKSMMNNLQDHFGTDASLDQETVNQILPFLEQNASQRAPEMTKKGEPVLRITETSWFKHEHDEISKATWSSAKVKSASNCMACHTSADKGNFDEDAVSIPR